jgi:nitrite reductase (NO-forming)
MKNKYLQALVVFAVAVGGYLVYQNVTYIDSSTQEEVNTVTDTPETEDKGTAEEETKDTTKTEDAFIGAHIMADGIVMTGAMKPIPGATILPDGNVELSDGTIFTPAFDLRKKPTAPDPIEEAPNQVVIDVIGVNFSYDVTEIKVKKGDVVTINFASTGGFHDWVIDEFGARTTRVDEGEKTSVTFIANKVGTFQYYCSIGTHRQKGQVGYLVVE